MAELGQNRKRDSQSRASALRRFPAFRGPRSNRGSRPEAVIGLPLLNDLVGAVEKRIRDGETERPRGLEIDDQLEVRRLRDRYIGTLGSAQNFSRRSCPLSQELGKPRTIANLCITANLAANVAVGS